MALINIKFAADLKEFSSKMQNANRSIAKMGKQMQRVGAGLSIGLTAPLTAVGVSALNTFKEVEGVRAAFERLNQPGLLANLQAATKGTVSNLELMKAAVQAKNFDIPLSQLSTLLEFARRRAKDTGESVDFLVQSIVTGIGRKSPLILDNLGISAAALKDELGGVSAASASIADVTKAVGTIARQELQKMGADTNTLKESMDQVRASFTNVSSDIGEILAPVLAKLVGWLQSAVDKFKTLSPEAKKFTVVVGAIAAAVGPVLTALGFLMTNVVPGLISAFGLLKTATVSIVNAFKSLNVAMLANPISLIVAGVSAVIYGFTVLVQKITPAVSKLQTFFNMVKSGGSYVKFTTLQMQSQVDAMVADNEAKKEANKVQEEFNKKMADAAINSKRLTQGLIMQKEAVTALSSAKALGGGAAGVGGNNESADSTNGSTSLSMAGFTDVLKIEAATLDETLTGMEDRMTRFGDVNSGVAGLVSGVFGAMGNSINSSLGDTSNALQSFMRILMQSVSKMITAYLAQSKAAAVAGASSSAAATGPGAIFSLPAFIATALTAVITAFTGIPRFATGGVVGGNSFTGDKILAAVNSGELILNQKQQRNLLGMMTPSAIVPDIVLQPSIKYEADGFRVMLERNERKRSKTI